MRYTCILTEKIFNVLFFFAWNIFINIEKELLHYIIFLKYIHKLLSNVFVENPIVKNNARTFEEISQRQISDMDR